MKKRKIQLVCMGVLFFQEEKKKKSTFKIHINIWKWVAQPCGHLHHPIIFS